jgi:hypothetical protein
MSVVSDRIPSRKIKKERISKMKLLSYTAEKDNSLVSVSNRLMVSEYQINDLLDSLVNNGYTILTTEIGDGDYSQHWNG